MTQPLDTSGERHRTGDTMIASLSADSGTAEGGFQYLLSPAMWVCAALAILVLVANVALYVVAMTWQPLVGTANSVLALCSIWLIRRSWGRGSRRSKPPVRRSKPPVRRSPSSERSAVIWLTITPLLMMFALSLLWGGLAPALGLAAFGIGFLIAFLTISPAQGAGTHHRGGSRDRALLSLISAGIGLGIWLMREVPLPWVRIDLSRYVSSSLILRVVIAGVVGIVLWQLALGYRRLRAIRSRLVVTFVIVVVGVALAVSVTSIVLGINTTQQRTFDQLYTAVVLKAQAVDTWLDQLRFSLESLVVEDYEVQRAQSVLLRSLTETFQLSAAQELRVRFGTVIRRTGWFTEIFLIDTSGEIVLSTNRSAEGRMVGERAYFQEALEDFYIAPPEYDPLDDGITMVIARPLRLGATTYGIVAARTDMGQLRAIASTGQIGNTGTTDFVNATRLWLNGPSLSGGLIPVQSQAIRAALRRPIGIQRAIYTSHRGARVSGAYIWLPRLQSALLMEQAQAEVLSGAVTTSVANAGVALLAVLVAVTIAIGFAESISRPLSDLAGMATRIAGGELDLNVDVVREDEVGAVALAFNAMTDQLRDLISGLEARVEERTRGLQAVADVSRATTSVLDPDQLLPQVVDLVQQRFDLYYVGLFLLDDERHRYGGGPDGGERAVLRAGTGAAGREMLAEGWSLAVGGDSMIGQCVATGDVVIKQQSGDAGGQDQDVVRFENSWLPDTRSELALPLRYGGSVIGAMTVQSVLPQAFDETVIAVLQNLADQMAVAVQNARLFAETQLALDRVRRAQRRYERQAWSAYLDMTSAERGVVGYERRAGAVQALISQEDTPLERLSAEARMTLASGQPVTCSAGDGSADGGMDHRFPPDEVQSDHQLLVPIVQSGQIIGTLGLQRERGWSTDDETLVQNLAEQLALAAENQRLFDATQRREAAERLAREVTTRMREPVELEDVLRTASEEIREALGCDWVVVRMVEAGQDHRDGQDRQSGEGDHVA